MYEFSTPMPYYKEHIDKLFEINNKVEKSFINTFYFSLPVNSIDYVGFEQGRFLWNYKTDFEYWKPLIEYSLNKGVDFIYLLNSPKIYNPAFDNLDLILEKLDKLINDLKILGSNKYRVCNPQLIAYLTKYYPDTEIYLSTSSELKSIKEYENMFQMFKNIKEFVPSWDLNKNIRFLKNIRKRFPDIKLELMVNEGCIPNCPIRTSHNIYITGIEKELISTSIFESQFYLKNCSKILNRNFNWYLCNANIIYPWEIEEYSKIGINNFKLVGRNSDDFRNGNYIKYYELYLKGIDNIKNIENTSIRYFNHYIEDCRNLNFTVKDIKSYLPKIQHFKKHGHECASVCGVNCNYCRKCAEKITNKFISKTKQGTSTNICTQTK